MKPTVAHCVSPYLFLTGSWIHSQLKFARRHRPVVFTQSTENLDVFPFEPVHVTGPQSGLDRLTYPFSRLVLGRFPAAPYARAVQETQARLLHAHLGWEGARVAPVARRLGLPLIVSFYGRDATLLPRKLYWRRLYRPLFRTATRILAEGHHMAKTLAEIGAPEDRIRVIHLGVDPGGFHFAERKAPAAGEPIIGLISASFREKKGIEYAIEATAQVREKHPAFRLRIVGDGPLRPHLESRITELGLSDVVELLGYQPYPVYREELERAHLFLAPSVVAKDGDTEGGAPVCLIDAQACGLPILATTHCDIPEITSPDQSSVLVPERDANALAEALNRLLSQPQSWADMGRKGRAHVEAEFDISRQVDRMADLYDEVLQETGMTRS